MEGGGTNQAGPKGIGSVSHNMYADLLANGTGPLGSQNNLQTLATILLVGLQRIQGRTLSGCLRTVCRPLELGGLGISSLKELG
jgi:hypothetical protein